VPLVIGDEHCTHRKRVRCDHFVEVSDGRAGQAQLRAQAAVGLGGGLVPRGRGRCSEEQPGGSRQLPPSRKSRA